MGVNDLNPLLRERMEKAVLGMAIFDLRLRIQALHLRRAVQDAQQRQLDAEVAQTKAALEDAHAKLRELGEPD